VAHKKQTPLVSFYYGFWNTLRAATTLPAAGLVVSTFDFAVLLLVAGAVFLLARDFFSMAIVVSPVYLTALRIPLVQVESQTRSVHATIVKLFKTNEHVKIICRPGQNQPRTKLSEG
jgi:hypothetical protein